MACSMNTGFSVCGSNETILCCNRKVYLGLSPPVGTLQFPDSKSKEFMGNTLDVLNHKGFCNWSVTAPRDNPIKAQASLCVSRVLRWWEKIPTANMIEIQSAQELVDTLVNAGDKLIVLDFYSPGCGGCRALHPKVCQLAEANPNALFLKVNMEELRTMCECLRVHVMPFFRLYRGTEGKVCSFSCTNATIKKFRDALAKYGDADDDRYRLGPAKGLEKKELLALASAGLISRSSLPEDIDKDPSDDDEDLLAVVLEKKKEEDLVFKDNSAFVMA